MTGSGALRAVLLAMRFLPESWCNGYLAVVRNPVGGPTLAALTESDNT
jgi:hypothetical protein